MFQPLYQKKSILRFKFSSLGKFPLPPPPPKSLQSCLTLCDPIDGSLPGSPVPGILQARTLEWVAISFSSAWKWKVKVKSLSRVWLIATPWTAAYQAPPSMGFSRQEYWSGVPLPSPKPASVLFLFRFCQERRRIFKSSLVAQMVKTLPATREIWVLSLSWEDPLEKEMTIHSSILAWRIPWTEDSGGLQSMGSHWVRHDWATNSKYWNSFLSYNYFYKLSWINI